MKNKLSLTNISLYGYFDKIIYFITGVVAFSHLSHYITIKLLNFPVYFPELLLLPIMIIKRNKIILYFKKILSNFVLVIYFFFSLIIIFMLIGIGYFYTYNLIDVLSTARSIIYICILAYFFSLPKRIDYNFLFYISFGAIIGELINSTFYHYLYHSTKHVGTNIIAVFFSIAIPIFYKDYIKQIFTSLLVALLIFEAGYRVLLFSAFFGFVFSHLYMLITSLKRKRVKFILTRFLIMILIVIVIIGFVNYYLDNFNVKHSRYFRIIVRTLYLFQGNIEKSQDNTRLEKLTWSWKKIDDKILPHGFITEAKGKYGDHKDIPVVYFYDTIGSIFTIPFLIWILLKGFLFLINRFRYQLKFQSYNVDDVIAISFFLIVLLLFSNGRFLYITYESCLFSIILGRWFK